VEKPPTQIINCLAFGLPNIHICDTNTVVLTGSTLSSNDLRHRKCNEKTPIHHHYEKNYNPGDPNPQNPK
jgi:hypothetical protein